MGNFFNMGHATLASFFKFLHGYSETAAKTLMAFFAGLGVVSELYNIYTTYNDPDNRQRKMRLGTYVVGFGLNTLYAIGSVFGRMFTIFGLSLVALAVELVALTRIAYQTHGARNEISEIKEELQEIQNEIKNENQNDQPLAIELHEIKVKLDEKREYRFQKKVEAFYSVMTTISAILFMAGFFVEPLAFVSLGIFAVSKIFQAYDNYKDYQLSRYVSSFWADDDHPFIQPEIEQELTSQFELLPDENNNSSFIFGKFSEEGGKLAITRSDAPELDLEAQIAPQGTFLSQPVENSSLTETPTTSFRFS